MKILLLEDEVMLNDSITEYLLTIGHSVSPCFDGENALQLLQKENFDLLILDINVPGIDGLSLLEHLHTLNIHTPTIYISALTDIEDISRAYDLGCYDYLKKPFHLKELSLRIHNIKLSTDIPRVHLRLSSSYSYDQEKSELLFNTQVQVLSKRQSQIIDLLARNRGRVVDFYQFQNFVWEDTIVDNATIRAEVNRLKKSLKEDFIQNIRALGYMIDIPQK